MGPSKIVKCFGWTADEARALAERIMTNLIRGLRVLVVEDEYLIALMIAEILEQAGYEVVGPVSSLDSALKLGHPHNMDSGLLDVNLNGEMVYPLADKLDSFNLPYVFVTGYGAVKLPERFRERPVLAKPFMPHVLLQTLQDVAAKGDRFNPATP